MDPGDRHLATILFTDIVDSTRRATELGDRGWRDLLQAHDAAVRSEIERHGGREWGTAGDGFLVTFEAPEQAVRCAVAVRDAVHTFDLRVRCGLHAGEVQRIGDGIGGIGVHIAARVAALAAPDEILVSRTVRDLVTGSGLAFQDRGKRALKGVEGAWRIYSLAPVPVRGSSSPARRWLGGRRAAGGAAVLVLGALALYAWVAGPPSFFRSPRGASVAVLPFANASPDPADEYFSDGLTEELISALAEIDGLRVPGRTSSFAFKNRAQDVREIGRILSVAHILEGSVRRSGQRLRIDARLLDASEGYEEWSESYDRTLADALEIQSSIARSIAEALEVELVPSGSGSSSQPSPEAYDLYLRALSFSSAPTETEVERAVDFFLQAIQADPDFAPAYAGLAIAYQGLGNRYGAGPAVYLPKAKAAAERALELDESLADSQLAIAVVKAFWDRDYEGAERAFRRAIELRPSSAAAYNHYAAFLVFMLRYDEGVRAGEKAISLDPLSNLYQVDFGAQLYLAGRFPDAARQLKSAIDRNPRDARAWFLLARVYDQLERWEDAFAAYDEAERLPGHEGIKILYKGHTLAVSGQQAAAEALLARTDSLDAQIPLRQTDFAALEVALGYRDRALNRIERAERERTLDPVPFQGDPRLDPLRSDPRFRAVGRRMGLPERGRDAS